MQSLLAEAVQIAHDLFQVTRDPFHGYPYSSTAWVTSARGCDLDDPSPPRQPDGSIARRHRGGSVVLLARTTLTLVGKHAAEP
eukprot:7247592-Pyramimonas_sp.AAC.1